MDSSSLICLVTVKKNQNRHPPPPRPAKKHITLDSNLLHLRYSLYKSASLITHFTLKGDKNMLYRVTIHWFFALMLLIFTMRLMVRSAHLTLSPRRFTALFDIAASNRYSYEKIVLHTASLVRRHGLISAIFTTSSGDLC